MAFVTNRGVSIYFQTMGEGSPLVLLHGLGGSGSDWIDLGYVDALKDRHQVILIDARGHGKSDKPHDPAAYDLAVRASDVVAVLDDLGHKTSDFFGYSMGGTTTYGLANYFSERIGSVIIGAAHPYAESLQPFRDLFPHDQAALAAAIDKIFGHLVPAAWRNRLVANDVIAIHLSARDRQSMADDVLPKMSMPCLLFVGELDPRLAAVQKCASQLRKATLLTLPGCDHMTALGQAEAVVTHINSFLASRH
ncbi:alpha/beta fold hydrolase [Leptospira interrogans]